MLERRRTAHGRPLVLVAAEETPQSLTAARNIAATAMHFSAALQVLEKRGRERHCRESFARLALTVHGAIVSQGNLKSGIFLGGGRNRDRTSQFTGLPFSSARMSSNSELSMSEERKYAILPAATILAARKLNEVGNKPSPAREACIFDAITKAELRRVAQIAPTGDAAVNDPEKLPIKWMALRRGGPGAGSNGERCKNSLKFCPPLGQVQIGGLSFLSAFAPSP